MNKLRCATCDMSVIADDCLIVVIETDTGGTLVCRKPTEDTERFNNRYHSLVDSGRYPNMSEPQVECKACRGLRYKEMEEELEYWNQKNKCYLGEN
jgi:hypothetical protein